VDSASVIVWKERFGVGVRKEAALTRGAVMSATGRRTPARTRVGPAVAWPIAGGETGRTNSSARESRAAQKEAGKEAGGWANGPEARERNGKCFLFLFPIFQRNFK
jgi:hypothetical protein